MKSTIFAQRVYDLCTKIPKGKVTTYGEIARTLRVDSPRAVGQALRCNPFAPTVPCHRVIRSDGTLGGFKGESAGKAIAQKVALLRREGVYVNAGDIDLQRYHFSFPRGV